MRKSIFKRAEWYLRFIQAGITDETKGKWAEELAQLLLIVDPTVSREFDDQRVSLALRLAESLHGTNQGILSESAEKLVPLLMSIQKLIKLHLDLLLLGQKMHVEAPARFTVRLIDPLGKRSGGLSSPEIDSNNQVFSLTMGHGNDDLVQWTLLNFALALSGLPRKVLGKCPECGKYFIVARKGNVFCSNGCSAKAGMRKRRRLLRENPEEHEQYLEEERERSHEKYQKRIHKQNPKAKVERRPRKQKKED